MQIVMDMYVDCQLVVPVMILFFMQTVKLEVSTEEKNKA
jgi:hypothetical protein